MEFNGGNSRFDLCTAGETDKIYYRSDTPFPYVEIY